MMNWITFISVAPWQFKEIQNLLPRLDKVFILPEPIIQLMPTLPTGKIFAIGVFNINRNTSRQELKQLSITLTI